MTGRAKAEADRALGARVRAAQVLCIACDSPGAVVVAAIVVVVVVCLMLHDDDDDDDADVCMEISGGDRNTVIAQTKAYFSKKPIHTRDGHADDIKGHNGFIYDFDSRMKNKPFKLFVDFIKEIAKIHNAKIAIVSSGTTGYITPKITEIKSLGIHPTHILTYEDHHSKEEKIEHICRDWNVNVNDVYYFTDAKADVYELENICDKEKLIGCGWGFLGAESLCEVLPRDQVLVNYDDVHNIFKSNFSPKATVFTTRPDTLFGVTYVVLAPEHAMVQELRLSIKNWKEVEQYIADTKRKDDISRTANEKDKTGVQLEGVFAINPANGESVPVWIADYVLANYGTGAVMGVPMHDERDNAFATKYGIDIFDRPLVDSKNIVKKINGKWVTKYKFRDAIFARQRYWGEPIPLIHSEIKYKLEVEFSGEFRYRLIKEGSKKMEVRALDKTERKKVKIGDVLKFTHIEKKESFFVVVKDLINFKNIPDIYKKGKPYFNDLFPGEKMDTVEDLYERYKKVDKDYEKRIDKYGAVGWIIEKLPDSRTIEEVSEKQLPLKLPNVKSYAPAGTGESPLSTVKSWVTSGYETNTMPGWAGSSWYFLRYTDPTNGKKFADSKELNYWFGKNGGVNMYVGGAEHSTGHLLYSRFWHKVLHDLGHVKSEEPFMKLRNQGMIGGADGRKMSKRWGNVVNPDDVVKQFGADTMRVYEAFVGPFESDLPWSTDGIVGSRRFIERIWRFQEKVSNAKTPIELQKSLHKTIKKVTDDIATFSFNTAVSAMMIFANELEKHESINAKDFKKFLQILAPFAPYMTDELWNLLDEKGTIHHAPWPKFDPKLIVDDTFTIGIQINGKTRAEITIPNDISQQELERQVFALVDVQKWINNSEIKKFIYVKGRIINIVI